MNIWRLAEPKGEITAKSCRLAITISDALRKRQGVIGVPYGTIFRLDFSCRFRLAAAMNPKTEEFLYFLLWGGETLMQPTFRNLNESFEGWAYRTGARQQLAALEKRKLIEKKRGNVAGRIYRLTEIGRLAALGGRDPLQRWDRSWDGWWRVVIFDLPERENTSRVRLRRFLKSGGFGFLQNSVWITPDPLSDRVKALAAAGENVESFLTLEARPCSEETDQAIVAGAWDFDRINRRYKDCLDLLKKCPKSAGTGNRDTAGLQQWARRERLLWNAAVQGDPLLPSVLLPPGYLGKEVWRARNSTLRKAGKWLVFRTEHSNVRRQSKTML